jgi:hypothetical protein
MAELASVYAAQYGANVYTMAQQQGSILKPFVTIEEMKGETRYFDRVKPTAAQKVSGKYMDTPIIPTQFDRRAVKGTEYVWADLLDWTDDLNVWIDPTSPIVRAGAMALGRTMDEIIIANAFGGAAAEGVNGETQVAFPESQKVGITFGGTGNTGLTIEKLRRAYSTFGKADIDLAAPGNELYIAVTQRQMDDLLEGVDVKNSLYSAMMDLYCGKTNKFLGFNFVRTELLQRTESGGGFARTCCAWCKSGVILCIPQEIKMTVNTRPDKNNIWQAEAKMKAGATRIEDAKVVQIFCQEAD